MNSTSYRKWLHRFIIVLGSCGILTSCGGKESLSSEYSDDACSGLFDVPGEVITTPTYPTIPADTPDQTTPITTTTELSAAVTFNNGIRKSGTIPAPVTVTGPTLSIDPSSIQITDNGEIEISITPSALVDGYYLGAVFLQFDGVAEYFIAVNFEGQLADVLAQETAAAQAARAAANDAGGSDTQLNAIATSLEAQAASTQALIAAGGVRITLNGPIPADGIDALIQGDPGDSFAANLVVQGFWVANDTLIDFTQATWAEIDNASLWSAETPLTGNAVAVGSGGFQATLTWNTGTTFGSSTGAVDIDLHVTEPNGTEIYYANSVSAVTGGLLDVDNTYGFGPENIYYPNDVTPPDGEYVVSVVYFAGSPVTRFAITVSACNDRKTYTGILTEANSSLAIEVVRFTLEPGCELPEYEFVSKKPSLDKPDVWEQTLLCTEEYAKSN